MSLAQARSQGAICASLDLIAEQQLEELEVAEALLLGLVQAQRKRVLHAAQLERLQRRNQLWWD
jgi:hypothetical protein